MSTATPVGAASGAPRWREVVADGRLPLTLGLVLVELLAGIQALVVTATMPRVLAELHGLAYYGWVFSGYSLAGLAAIPRAGHDADVHGPHRPLLEGFIMFGCGTVLAGLAPSMLTLALVRVIQGYGAATLYTVAYGVVAKAYPERLRARVIALLTLVWVASGLVGPAYGAALAAAAGWRWSFLSVFPFVVLAWLLISRPARGINGGEAAANPIGQRWPVQLALGSGALLAGLSATSLPVAVPLALGGGALAGHALGHVLPAGTMRLAPGLPATVAVAFLLNLAFFAADSFVPLLLTGVRGVSILTASIAVTLVTLGWSGGSWWQSRVMSAPRAASLVLTGALLLGAGIAGTTAALLGAPLLVVYASWIVAGVGMGIAYSTAFVASMDAGGAGTETAAVAARMLSGRLGIALGSGVGGACVAIATVIHAGLATGLWGVFALALAAALAAAAAAHRLVPATGQDSLR